MYDCGPGMGKMCYFLYFQLVVQLRMLNFMDRRRAQAHQLTAKNEANSNLGI